MLVFLCQVKYFNKAVFILKMFYMKWEVEMGGEGHICMRFSASCRKRPKKKKNLKSKVKM